ncbi:hypothetical protein K505DRAFT_360210 [Melanomma pulvis-pyrius CBS 109.77]|uniref:Uncharacterized protein n=1 Tax=Melanomma pulvis-pyrius CBS 109.77 TaxID=1314802 RepID=A0A6A6XH49_9PLEO|nr:hypothetical protein K505DRAFT_360210 [Melanomma pulvis-pyrius CBS 109.77]
MSSTLLLLWLDVPRSVLDDPQSGDNPDRDFIVGVSPGRDVAVKASVDNSPKSAIASPPSRCAGRVRSASIEDNYDVPFVNIECANPPFVGAAFIDISSTNGLGVVCSYPWIGVSGVR